MSAWDQRSRLAARLSSRLVGGRRAAAGVALLALALASLGLSACGQSSPSSSASAAAGKSTQSGGSATKQGTASGAAPSVPGAVPYKALRECLSRNGVSLPRRRRGQRAPGGGIFRGNGSRLPNGVSRAKFEAALKKCGAGARVARRGRLLTPAYRRAVASFAACMREHGVYLPAPNTSGRGPIFSTPPAARTGPAFHSALRACRGLLAPAAPGGPEK
jgi:hypothetical protein